MESRIVDVQQGAAATGSSGGLGTTLNKQHTTFRHGASSDFALSAANGLDDNGVDEDTAEGWTAQVGVAFDVCVLGVCGSAAIGPVLGRRDDGFWSFELLNYAGGAGVATQPGSFDFSFFAEKTNAGTVDDLNGFEGFAGFGFGEGITGAVDSLWGIDPDSGKTTYEGVRFQLGAGAGVAPVDMHAGGTAGFNTTRLLYGLILLELE